MLHTHASMIGIARKSLPGGGYLSAGMLLFIHTTVSYFEELHPEKEVFSYVNSSHTHLQPLSRCMSFSFLIARNMYSCTSSFYESHPPPSESFQESAVFSPACFSCTLIYSSALHSLSMSLPLNKLPLFRGILTPLLSPPIPAKAKARKHVWSDQVMSYHVYV